MTSPQEQSSFRALFAQFGSTLDQWFAASRTETARLSAANARILALEHKFEDLDKRFTKVLEQSFKEAAPDTLTLDDQQRQDLADRFKTLFEQIDHAYTRIYDRKHHGAPDLGSRAEWLTNFLWAIHNDEDPAKIHGSLQQFTPTEPALYNVSELIERFGALRRRVLELDQNCLISFDYVPGPVDSRTQRPWKHCDPDGDVVFAVTPSYSVGTRLFLHQQVFTAPRQVDAG
ncbi:MAG TPA: hypothetical protein VL551_18380 [Actinospica sp.]|jgi:hypothetical protein|nr:hypothetical protein [Actinospica sp.]